MKNLPNKTDDADSLPAADWSDHKNELQESVTESGQTLDSTKTNQLRSAMQYYGRSLYCKDTGAANVYVLAKPSATTEVKAYYDGLTLFFDTANANTGASTVNLNSLGAKKIQTASDAAITVGTIVPEQQVLLVYDSALDSAAGAFKIVPADGSVKGSNVNGEFVKFADGTMICTFAPADETSLALAVNASLELNSATSYTFAAAFAAPPKISFDGHSRFGSGIHAGVALNNSFISSAQYRITIRNSTDATIDNIVNISMIAIGRWKV